MKMRIFHRGLILVGAPLLLELVLIGSLSSLLYKSAQERVIETRYRKYSSEIARLLGYVSSAPLVIAASVHFQSDKLFHEYSRQELEINHSMVELRKIVREIPEISPREYVDLSNSVRAILRMTHSLSTFKNDIAGGTMPMGALQEFQSSLGDAKQVVALHLDEMFRLSDKMVAAAQKNLDNTRQSQFVILVMVFVLNIIMAVLLGLFYKFGIVNRIRTIARNTEALSRAESLAPEIGGNDEIAQFDQAFHSMLEQLLRAAHNEQELFDNASDVICVLDSENTFVRVNPASWKDWGMKPDQIIGKRLNDLLSADDMPVVNASIAETRRTNNAVSFEARVKAGDQNIKVGLWSAYWAQDEQRLFCIVHDVSERKLIELAKKQFLTLISSDLKIPLSKISTALNKLPELSASNLNELGKDKLKMAKKNVERLLSLVNDLLEVAQMDSGNVEIHPADADIQELLSRAVADVEPLAQAKNLQIEVLPCQGSVFADANRIMQVLINLLSNAIKFTAEGKKVVLSAETQGDFVVCRVSDQGRGVPESHRESIFERFSQVEKQDGKRKAGTGLGLPICKQIVEKHGGKIGVESQEGEGSTFWFSLPGLANAGGFEPEPKPDDSQAGKESVAKCSLPQPAESPAKEKAPFGTSLPLGSKGVVLVGIPVIIELIFVAILSNSLLELQKDRTQELHNRQMAVEASKVSKAVLYASSVVTDNADSLAWKAMQSCYREWAESQKELEKLVDDDPYAKKQFEKLLVHSRKIKAYRDALLQQKNENSESGVAASLAQKVKFLPSALSLTMYLRAIIDHAERKEFMSPEKELQTLQTQSGLLLFGVLVNISFSVALAMFFSLSISKRILIMANNAERLANDEELNPLMGGKDELANLDRSFHQTASALAQARKKERAVFDNSKDVLCIISPSAGFLSVNAAAEASWGYSKKELLESSLEAVILPDDLTESKSALLGEIDPSRGKSHECRIRKKDGETIHVLFAASRQSDQANTFCVVHDIGDRIALEQLRQDFLAMVSHDLRTPLTAINGVAQIMQAGVFGVVSEEAAPCLVEIRRNVESLLELIGDILDLEKLDAGRMQLSKEACKINEVVDEVKKQVAFLQGTLKCEVRLKDGFVLEADKERFTQSICNLAKFLHLRSGTELTLLVNQDEKGLELKLIDNGPALSDLACKQLFQRVKEPSESRNLGADATFHADLVLPLAAKTIESHGGSISVETLEDRQNIIRVFMPARASILI